MEKIEGQCDVCNKHDGYHEHNLQKCAKCSVKVHELCYGMVPTSCKDPNFICHACKSVGMEVEVNVPSRLGGPTLKDVLGTEDGVESFREFLREKRSSMGSNWDVESSDEKRVALYAEASKFKQLSDRFGVVGHILCVLLNSLVILFCNSFFVLINCRRKWHSIFTTPFVHGMPKER